MRAGNSVVVAESNCGRTEIRVREFREIPILCPWRYFRAGLVLTSILIFSFYALRILVNRLQAHQLEFLHARRRLYLHFVTRSPAQ